MPTPSTPHPRPDDVPLPPRPNSPPPEIELEYRGDPLVRGDDSGIISHVGFLGVGADREGVSLPGDEELRSALVERELIVPEFPVITQFNVSHAREHADIYTLEGRAHVDMPESGIYTREELLSYIEGELVRPGIAGLEAVDSESTVIASGGRAESSAEQAGEADMGATSNNSEILNDPYVTYVRRQVVQNLNPNSDGEQRSEEQKRQAAEEAIRLVDIEGYLQEDEVEALLNELVSSEEQQGQRVVGRAEVEFLRDHATVQEAGGSAAEFVRLQAQRMESVGEVHIVTLRQERIVEALSSERDELEVHHHTTPSQEQLRLTGRIVARLQQLYGRRPGQ